MRRRDTGQYQETSLTRRSISRDIDPKPTGSALCDQPAFEWQTASTLFPLGSIRKAA